MLRFEIMKTKCPYQKKQIPSNAAKQMSAVDGVALGPGLGRHMDEVAQVQRMRPCCCFTTSHNISKVRSALPAKRSVQKRAFFFILPILRRCRAFAGSSKTLAKVLAPGPNR